MFKSILIKTALASMMIGSLGASANTTVDLFSDDQVYQTVQGGSTYNDATGPDIIGGQRDILITAGSNVRASTDVAGNELKIASNVSTTGATAANTEFTVEVQWDGVDSTSDTSLLDLTPGITPVADFSTLNGFSATINQSDGAGFFEIFLYNSAGLDTTVLLPFNPVTLGLPVTFSIPFAYFVPAIDLTEIIAIVLKMTSIGNTDINVASISAVPAPSSLAVLGLGLLAFTGFARRKA
jgi:hypothetical protein